MVFLISLIDYGRWQIDEGHVFLMMVEHDDDHGVHLEDPKGLG